jgi:hypothetical protein
MKGSIKKIFGRSKKRSSLDNRSGSCHSNRSSSDPSHSGSQDLSKSSERESKAPAQATSSKDFTLPAESSLYTLGDDLESRAFRDSRSSAALTSSATVDAPQPPLRPAGLEPIASESQMQVEDDPDITESTEAVANCTPGRAGRQAVPASTMENDFQTSGMIDMISDSPEHSKAYELVPELEQTKLPRGGVSIETKAVGRVQVRVTAIV